MRMIENRNTFPKEYFSCIAACITILIFIGIKATNYRFPQLPWYPPVAWGLPKELFIDPIIIYVFAWSGWVFLLPLLVGIYYKSSYRILFCTFALTSITVGILETVFNFSKYNLHKFILGVLTYTVIFGTIFIIVIVIKLSLGRFFK